MQILAKTTSTSAVLEKCTSTLGVEPSVAVTGQVIPAFAVVLSKDSSTQVTLTDSATASSGTSSTSENIGTGTRNYTTQTGLGYAAGERIRAYQVSDEAVYNEGTVTSYTTGTGELVLNITTTSGGGTGLTGWAFLRGITFAMDTPLSGTVSVSATVSCEATDARKDLGTPTLGVTGAVTCEGTKNERRALSGSVPVTATVACEGARHWGLGGSVPVRGQVACALSFLHPLRGSLRITGAASCVGLVDGQGLVVRDVALAAYALLQGGCGCDLPADTCLRDALLHEINGALQTIYARGSELGYFNRDSETLTFPAGVDAVPFSKDIQGLHGAVRLADSRLPLREVRDRMTFERFVETFCMSTPPEPLAYHLREAHESTGDNVALTLMITPAPAVERDVVADVIREAPRYTWTDVTAGTPLQLPHRYAESLLIPLVREWATTHEWFTKPELLPQIKAQAEMARALLGMVGGGKMTNDE